MKKIFILCFSLLFTEFAGNNIYSASIIRGPYLNMATQNSVHIRWRTDISTNSVVQFGTTDGALLSTKSDNALVTEHDIIVTGLAADTKYFYAVGSTYPAVQTFKSGADYFFSTLPVKGAERLTRIWAVGDCGNNSSNQLNVRNNYMKYMGSNHTDLMLLLGDNAYDAGQDNEYQTNFYSIYQDSVLRNVVLWPAPGNHDYANNNGRQNDHNIPYYDMFSLPANGESGGVPSGTEAYYSYDFGNIHFLSLDSYGKDSNTYFLYDTLGPQVRWIKKDLEANTQKWTIAYWHHPPFTLGSHNSEIEGDLINIRYKFIRILERYGVDVVLCGHSHVYERSYFLNGYYGSENSFNLATNSLSSSTAKYNNTTNSCPYIKNEPQKKGTVYVVSGSAGKLGGSPLNFAWPHNAMVYSNKDIGGGLALTVQGNRLDAEWVCSDGAVRDRFTMMKDVNKKTTFSIPQGNNILLSSSWTGSYNWTGGLNTQNINFSGSSAKTDTIIVTDAFSCLKDSFIIKKTNLTAIQNQKTENNIKVYPNPSGNGEFTVDYFSSKNSIIPLMVIDVLGKVVFKDEWKINNGNTHYNLNLKNISSGIYFLYLEEDFIKIEKQ